MALNTTEESPTTTKENIMDPDNEKNVSRDVDVESAEKRNFGGLRSTNKRPGARICPILPHLAGYEDVSSDSGSDILGKQIEMESDNAIKYRTCSWQKASLL